MQIPKKRKSRIVFRKIRTNYVPVFLYLQQVLVR